MAQVITFPPVDKADYYVKRNDHGATITGYLRDASGPVDLLASTVRFTLRAESSSVNKFKSLASVIADPAFTASGAVLTAAGHSLVAGDRVWLKTTGTLPAGLAVSTNYYVVNTATNTLGLSTIKGGTAITTTTAGTGVHTIIASRARYTFTATDTDTSGNYYGEFEVTFADSTVETFPNNKYIFVVVLADAG